MAELCSIPLCLLYAAYGFLHLASGSGIAEVKASQPAEIRARIGEPVTLSCTFNHTKDLDSAFGKFHTKKNNSEIKGKQSVKCTKNVSDDSKFLCEFSVYVNKIGLKDENVYYCEHLEPSPDGTTLIKGTGTKLSPYAEPSSVEIQLVLVSGQDQPAFLLCTASQFYPENVSVTWSHRGHPVSPSSITTQSSRTSNGTFTVQRRHSFIPTAADDSTSYSCHVTHPYWPEERTADITLYGPRTVTVTSSSAAVTDGSVHVSVGSSLNFTCAADGNPKPEAKWLGGNNLKEHHGQTLTIPSMQKEDEGHYVCVVRNWYGEKNSSIHLLVSPSSGNGLSKETVSIVVVVLMLTLLLFTILIFWKRRRNRNVSGGDHPHSEISVSERAVLYEVYAAPKKTKRQSKQSSPAPRAMDESQLIYADITVSDTRRPANATAAMSIYSEVGTKNLQRAEQQQHEQMNTIYTLATHPKEDGHASPPLTSAAQTTPLHR